jgi:hypothetical protein
MCKSSNVDTGKLMPWNTTSCVKLCRILVKSAMKCESEIQTMRDTKRGTKSQK